jgi:hypothetical protein
MDEGMSKTGGCLCGAVRFTATPLTHEVDACHCGKCRKWSGGIYMAVPCSDVAIADEAAVSAFKSSDYAERVFCKTCGSSLFWRMHDGSVVVAAMQAFDDLTGFVLAEEVFVDEKPAIYAFANPTRKLTGDEFFARYAASQEQAGG